MDVLVLQQTAQCAQNVRVQFAIHGLLRCSKRVLLMFNVVLLPSE
jgi:hypothetical protein